MIGLDTNILIRYLTQDDPRLSPKATVLIERSLSPDNPGFVGVITIAETVWVLDRSYSFTEHEIADAIERLLRMNFLVLEHKQHVYTATVLLREHGSDLADVLIGLVAREAGCSHTFTLDRRAARLPGFKLLS